MQETLLIELYEKSIVDRTALLTKVDKLENSISELTIDNNHHKRLQTQYRRLIIDKDEEVLSLQQDLFDSNHANTELTTRLDKSQSDLELALTAYKQHIDIRI